MHTVAVGNKRRKVATWGAYRKILSFISGLSLLKRCSTKAHSVSPSTFQADCSLPGSAIRRIGRLMSPIRNRESDSLIKPISCFDIAYSLPSLPT